MRACEDKGVNVAVLLVIGLTIVSGLGCGDEVHAPARAARVDVQVIADAVQLYIMQGAKDCPDVDDLISEHFLDERAGWDARTDPWGTPYRIECTGDTIRISSAGPDRQFGTVDDESDGQ